MNLRNYRYVNYTWLVLLLFFLWTCLSLFWAGSFYLAFYRLIMLAQALVIAFFVRLSLRSHQGGRSPDRGAIEDPRQGRDNLFLWLLVGLAIFESLIGFAQVVLQGSVGLYKLGEPHLNFLDQTISKTIVSGGGRLLRAYGTFPHPNILGAFLLVGLITFIYLLNRVIPALRPSEAFSEGGKAGIHSNSFYGFLIKSGMTTALFILLLGLILTFSRAAWLVGSLTVLICLTRLFLAYRNKSSAIAELLFKRCFLFFLIIFILISIFSWAVFPKLNFSLRESAISQRLAYLKIGWEIFKTHPLIGVGLANEVFYAKENHLFEKFGLHQELQKQPIHNIYLLILSELGLIGLGLFLIFIFFTLKNIFKKVMLSGELAVENVIWLAFLGLGLFDHFFWTIPVGQVVFWGAALLVI